jgi:hypothetical protein
MSFEWIACRDPHHKDTGSEDPNKQLKLASRGSPDSGTGTPGQSFLHGTENAEDTRQYDLPAVCNMCNEPSGASLVADAHAGN